MPCQAHGPTGSVGQAAQRREEEEEVTDPIAVVWGLFVMLEKAEGLPDPEVDAFVEAAEAEIGTDGLLSGWAIVAALLRKRLIEHAVPSAASAARLSG
jgi:hypothetical protein